MSLVRLLRKYAGVLESETQQTNHEKNKTEKDGPEDFEERAAILEFEAGMARDQAEQVARD